MIKFYRNFFSRLFAFKMADDEVGLDQSMQNILRDIQSRGDDDPPQSEPAVDEKDTDEGIEAESETEDEPDETETDAVEDEPEVEAAEADDEEEKPETKPTESKTPVRPPSSWTAKAKRDFANLPDHIQQEVVKREADFHKGIENYKTDADYARQIRDIVSPYMPTIQAQGSTPEKAIQSLLQTSYVLSTASPQDKGKLLMQVAQQYGADMSQFTGQRGQQGQGQRNGQQDNYVRQLEQRLAQIEGNLTSQQQAAQQRQAQQATQSIESFRNEVDEAGRLKHTYFDDVRDDMANFIELEAQQGRELSLADAYEKAIYARPDIRELVLTEAQQREQANRKKEQAKKAREAKRKGNVNLSTKGNHANRSQQPVGSVEDTMRQQLEAIKSREA